MLFTRDPLDPDGKRDARGGVVGAGRGGRVGPRAARPVHARPRHRRGARAAPRARRRSASRRPARNTSRPQSSGSSASVTPRCHSSRNSAARSRRSTATRATSSGPSPTARSTCLQARPITVAGAAEREQVRQAVIAELKAKADPSGTVWVRYNLSEVLPEPTPMTWAVVQRLLAADGGFGAMNRDLGAKPDPALGSLSGVRPRRRPADGNLSRLPRMQFARPPFEYPLGLYKADPRKALDPKPMLNPLAGRGCFLGVFALPGTIWKLFRHDERDDAAVARRSPTEVHDGNRAAVRRRARSRRSRRTGRSSTRRRSCASSRRGRTARWSSSPATASSRRCSRTSRGTTSFETLKPKLGEERARVAVGELSLGAAAAGRREPRPAAFATSRRDDSTRAEFLEQFGHRGTNEMELAQPRWSEAPAGTRQARSRRERAASTAAVAADVGEDRGRGEARRPVPRSAQGEGAAAPHVPRACARPASTTS